MDCQNSRMFESGRRGRESSGGMRVDVLVLDGYGLVGSACRLATDLEVVEFLAEVFFVKALDPLRVGSGAEARDANLTEGDIDGAGSASDEAAEEDIGVEAVVTCGARPRDVTELRPVSEVGVVSEAFGAVTKDSVVEEVLEVLAVELVLLVLGALEDNVAEVVEGVKLGDERVLGPTSDDSADAVDADGTVLGFLGTGVDGEVEELEVLVGVLGDDVRTTFAKRSRSTSTRRCYVDARVTVVTRH